jgi:hypothetical protein
VIKRPRADKRIQAPVVVQQLTPQLVPGLLLLLALGRLRVQPRPGNRLALKLVADLVALLLDLGALLVLREAVVVARAGLYVLVFPVVEAAVAGVQLVLRDELLEVVVAAGEVDLGRDDGV